MAIGIVGVPFGLAFAPSPCLESQQKPSPGIRWIGPIAIAAGALGFMAMTLAMPAPFVRDMAMASVTLLASVLIPVAPFDGAELRNKRVDFGITAVLLLATVSFAVKWI